jgi:hypothetical protein
MRRRLFSGALALGTLAAVGSDLSGQVRLEWMATYDGPGRRGDWVEGAILDPSGNYILAGKSGGLNNDSFAVVKFDPTGKEVWVAPSEANFPLVRNDSRIIAVDSGGNVFVVPVDCAVIKYDPDGQVVWTARADLPGGCFGHQLALDSDGNVVVAGSNDVASDILLVKYDASGELLWTRAFDRNGSVYDSVSSMAVDREGGIYLGGTTGGTDAARGGFTLLQYSRGGDLLWDVHDTETAGPFVAVDSTGDVVTFSVGHASLRKYSPEGALLWSVDETPDGNQTRLGGMTLDELGNVYLATYVGAGEYVSIVKYDPRGQEIWRARKDNGYVIEVVLDAHGSVYANSAFSGSPDYADQRVFAVVKWDASGTEEWTAWYGEPRNHRAMGLSIDAQENVLVADSSTSGNRPPADFLAFKFVQDSEVPSFRRGDSNSDGTLNLADPVHTLDALFRSGPAPACADAADANDEGTLNVTDAVYTLNHLFRGGPAPPAPGAEACGVDPTEDALPACTYLAERC